MASKTLYHSELANSSPVLVTVKLAPQASKFKKPGTPNQFAILVINNEERSYTCESQACVNFLTQHVGQTLEICADGRGEDATIKATDDGSVAPQRQTPAPTQRQQPAQTPPPVAKLTQDAPVQLNGATVGMAINNACASITAQGHPLHTVEGQDLLWQTATAILRVSYKLEHGQFYPKA